ncbi:DNA modification methylase [Bremerella sp. JC817]|uniref:DNA modification methylase n=1 Tax=Bremerella sp. JC817 TaxID=3231756 RepID=UPI00345A26F2
MTTSPYQFLPPLLPDEFEALKASVAEGGVDVPIIVDQEGNVIDGYHRQRACDDLGLFCPREVRQFESETDKFELVLRLNCGRRQLNRQQKRSVIDAYLLRDPQIADNFLAQIIGVSKNTVADVRSTLEATCQIDKFDELRGKDGKMRPVTYKKIIANTPKEAEAALKIIGKLPDNCTGKTIDIATAKRESRKAKAIPPQQGGMSPVSQTVGNVEVWCGDSLTLMRERMAPKSVDVAVTSVPYNVGKDYGTYDDDRPETEYLDWLAGCFETIHGVLKDDGSFFLNIDSPNSNPWRAMKVAEIAGRIFSLQNRIIWAKTITADGQSHGQFSPNGSDRYLDHTWEFVFHFTKTGEQKIDRLAIGVPYADKGNLRRNGTTSDLRCAGDVWFIPHPTITNRSERGFHPCPFPVELAERCIKLHGIKESLFVLDPFNGSGSSTEAMARLCVDGIGIDIDPAYCEFAVERLSRLEDERRAQLISELCIHIEDAYDLELPMNASLILGKWSELEGVPVETAQRLVPFLPDDLRRLLISEPEPAA